MDVSVTPDTAGPSGVILCPERVSLLHPAGVIRSRPTRQIGVNEASSANRQRTGLRPGGQLVAALVLAVGPEADAIRISDLSRVQALDGSGHGLAAGRSRSAFRRTG